MFFWDETTAGKADGTRPGRAISGEEVDLAIIVDIKIIEKRADDCGGPINCYSIPELSAGIRLY